jgi:hypothetical protein
MKKNFDVAAYIWPSYHYEPRMERFWPEKDGEWYTVRRATPRFPGHDMPRIPLLGYQDEASPAVMRQHVDLAREYGVNTFIMDWYWYDNEPCFERQLNDGLIPALQGSGSRFYLMWANHDATTMWDMHTDANEFVHSAAVSRAMLEPMFERIIDRYFSLDSYYRIDDCPVFCVFRTSNLIRGLGGVRETRDALDWMRQRCREKGYPGLHLQNIAVRGQQPEGGDALNADSENAVARELGYDSATCYQFCHQAGHKGDYVVWCDKAISAWPAFEATYPSFFPHVSIGWDNTQRHPSAKDIVHNATPSAFEACLWKARRYVETHPDQPPLVTVNSWNEWTEGSYLLPDMRWGYDYLRAVRNVFGPCPPSARSRAS